MSCRLFKFLLLPIILALTTLPASAGSITIAAAADLKFAMDNITATFRKAHPDDSVKVIYGSSGKFYTQIRQGAPFDLFFSADIGYPKKLARAGLTASTPRAYALGRIVLWSAEVDASKLSLEDLVKPSFDRIAVANPQHAPYGERAVEALKSSGVWNQVKGKLVYGENIGQTAQFVRTGNARIGIIALSLALNPAFASRGGYATIPTRLYKPLIQGFVITRHAADNPLAKTFAKFIDSASAQAIFQHSGFARIPAGPAP